MGGIVARYFEFSRPTLRYWGETEVHVYAFSIAANVLMSFFPFLLVMTSLLHHVLRWPQAENAVYLALTDYFPGDTGAFLVRNVKATVYSRGPVQWFSMLLLMFTANGVFGPLEVALNRAWRFTRNRSLWMNQLVSLGLIFACGALAFVSTIFTGMNTSMLATGGVLSVVLFKLAAIPASIGILFLCYWLLPVGKVDVGVTFQAALRVGLVLEGMKYINLLIWPWMYQKLAREYGPFVNSATIVIWSFVAALIILAGAEWAARKKRAETDGMLNRSAPASRSSAVPM